MRSRRVSFLIGNVDYDFKISMLVILLIYLVPRTKYQQGRVGIPLTDFVTCIPTGIFSMRLSCSFVTLVELLNINFKLSCYNHINKHPCAKVNLFPVYLIN